MKKRLVNYKFSLSAILSIGLLASSVLVNGQSQTTEIENVNEAPVVVQDKAVRPQAPIPCPFPTHIHQMAPLPTAATPYLPDFPTSSCSAGFEPNFGGIQIDRCFRHTFTWKLPTECCQCLSGTLTLQYTALQGGGPGCCSANDTVTIFSNGSAVTSQPLYTGVPTPKKILTKIIPLKCEWLTNHRISFLVQDDTSVISATLDIDYCCVKR